MQDGAARGDIPTRRSTQSTGLALRVDAATELHDTALGSGVADMPGDAAINVLHEAPAAGEPDVAADGAAAAMPGEHATLAANTIQGAADERGAAAAAEATVLDHAPACDYAATLSGDAFSCRDTQLQGNTMIDGDAGILGDTAMSGGAAAPRSASHATTHLAPLAGTLSDPALALSSAADGQTFEILYGMWQGGGTSAGSDSLSLCFFGASRAAAQGDPAALSRWLLKAMVGMTPAFMAGAAPADAAGEQGVDGLRFPAPHLSAPADQEGAPDVPATRNVGDADGAAACGDDGADVPCSHATAAQNHLEGPGGGHLRGQGDRDGSAEGRGASAQHPDGTAVPNAPKEVVAGSEDEAGGVDAAMGMDHAARVPVQDNTAQEVCQYPCLRSPVQ